MLKASRSPEGRASTAASVWAPAGVGRAKAGQEHRVEQGGRRLAAGAVGQGDHLVEQAGPAPAEGLDALEDDGLAARRSRPMPRRGVGHRCRPFPPGDAARIDHSSSISASWASWIRWTLSERTTRQWSDGVAARHGRPLVAAQADGEEAPPRRLLEGAEHVDRVAAGGEPDGDVAGPGVGDDLPGEDELEADVVGQRGQHGPVVDQGQGRERPARAGGGGTGPPSLRRRWRCHRCRRRRAGRPARSGPPWPRRPRARTSPQRSSVAARSACSRPSWPGPRRPGRPGGRRASRSSASMKG